MMARSLPQWDYSRIPISWAISDCCTLNTNGSATCADERTKDCVCKVLPSCCTSEWTVACIAEAAITCSACPTYNEQQRQIAALLRDNDGDGILTILELQNGTNPDEWDNNDVDGDGYPNSIDPDVDGDNVLNAYDDDVDGDGLVNWEDDDIDGDGLLNDLMDNDNDGDGVDNDRDDDDDADGIPDGDDEDEEEQHDGDNSCEEHDDCGFGEACTLTVDSHFDITKDKFVDTRSCTSVSCTNDSECGANGICATFVDSSRFRLNTRKCTDWVPTCSRADDMDKDGVCDWGDPDPDGNGDRDNDNDGLPDRDELFYGTDMNDADADGDGDSDLVELLFGFDPNDPFSDPFPETFDEFVNDPFEDPFPDTFDEFAGNDPFADDFPDTFDDFVNENEPDDDAP